MKKKIIAIMTIVTLLITSAIPAFASGGDNTGDDNFGANIIIATPALSEVGDYTLGDVFTFTTEFYASEARGLTANREVTITSDKSFSDFQYLGKVDDSFGSNLNTAEWRSVELFNTQITVGNDVGRQFKVKFNEDGVYAIDYVVTSSEGKVIAKMITRYITIKDGKYSSSKTAPEVPTEKPSDETPSAETPSETSTQIQTPSDETPSAEAPSDETPSAETPSESQTSVQEPTGETPSESQTSVQEPTGETPSESQTSVQEPTGETPSESQTSVQESTEEITTAPVVSTTIIVEPTSKIEKPTKKVTPKKATVLKATKKKTARKAKIKIKKVKKVAGYQIQICTKRKFSKKLTVTKNSKKPVYTFKKLKPRKKYYVRARVYVKVKGTKVFGPWSNKKRVKFVK